MNIGIQQTDPLAPAGQTCGQVTLATVFTHTAFLKRPPPLRKIWISARYPALSFDWGGLPICNSTSLTGTVKAADYASFSHLLLYFLGR